MLWWHWVESTTNEGCWANHVLTGHKANNTNGYNRAECRESLLMPKCCGFYTAHPAGNGPHHGELICRHVCACTAKCPWRHVCSLYERSEYVPAQHPVIAVTLWQEVQTAAVMASPKPSPQLLLSCQPAQLVFNQTCTHTAHMLTQTADYCF